MTKAIAYLTEAIKTLSEYAEIGSASTATTTPSEAGASKS